MRIQGLFYVCVLLLLLASCHLVPKNQRENNFVQVQNGQFVRKGKPYYFIGTNFWYGAILASEGQGGGSHTLVL